MYGRLAGSRVVPREHHEIGQRVAVVVRRAGVAAGLSASVLGTDDADWGVGRDGSRSRSAVVDVAAVATPCGVEPHVEVGCDATEVADLSDDHAVADGRTHGDGTTQMCEVDGADVLAVDMDVDAPTLATRTTGRAPREREVAAGAWHEQVHVGACRSVEVHAPLHAGERVGSRVAVVDVVVPRCWSGHVPCPLAVERHADGCRLHACCMGGVGPDGSDPGQYS